MDYTTASKVLSGEYGLGYARKLVTPRPERESVKVGNNTYLERRGPSTIALRLHATDVLTFTPDYVELNTGGWFTVTTKARLNQFGPVTISSDKGRWIVQPAGYDRWATDGFVYHDGIRFTNDGTELVKLALPVTVPDNEPVKRQIRAFCVEAMKQLREGLPMPSGGDCWGCYFRTDDGKGDVLGLDHLTQHMEEGYVVPSLLWNAVSEAGYRFPEIILGAHENGDGYALGGTVTNDYGTRPRATEQSVSRALNRYLKRRLVPNETA